MTPPQKPNPMQPVALRPQVPLSERRADRRVPLSAHAVVTIMNGSKDPEPTVLHAVATDLSTTGVRLKCYQLSRDHTRLISDDRIAVTLEIDLPYLTRAVYLRGHVVHTEEYPRTNRDEAHHILGVHLARGDESTTMQIKYVLDMLSTDIIRGNGI